MPAVSIPRFEMGRVRQAWRRRISLPVLRWLHPQVELRLGGQRLCVDLRDGVISRLLYLTGTYEPQLQRLFRSIDLRGATCLDIGANIGLHTVAMSQLVGPTGQVYAFEPEPNNARLLQHNLQVNGISNVIVKRSAIGDREGHCFLAVNTSNHGDHRVSSNSSDDVVIREVPMATIDACMRSIPAGAVKLIKIDVQGYEYQVIRGMRTTLRRNPAAIVLLEVYPDALREAGTSASGLMQLLRDLGLTGWELHAHRLIPMAEPWVYELISAGKDVNVVVSANAEHLVNVLGRYFGRPIQRSCADEVRLDGEAEAEREVGEALTIRAYATP
jgi:FkbM family methyltransferase